jgi:hypothetical protein
MCQRKSRASAISQRVCASRLFLRRQRCFSIRLLRIAHSQMNQVLEGRLPLQDLIGRPDAGHELSLTIQEPSLREVPIQVAETGPASRAMGQRDCASEIHAAIDVVKKLRTRLAADWVASKRVSRRHTPARRHSVTNPLVRIVAYAWKCDGPALSVRHIRA